MVAFVECRKKKWASCCSLLGEIYDTFCGDFDGFLLEIFVMQQFNEWSLINLYSLTGFLHNVAEDLQKKTSNFRHLDEMKIKLQNVLIFAKLWKLQNLHLQCEFTLVECHWNLNYVDQWKTFNLLQSNFWVLIDWRLLKFS